MRHRWTPIKIDSPISVLIGAPSVAKALTDSKLMSTYAYQSLTTLALAFTASVAHAQAKITFDDNALPIFRSNCLNCHNPDKKRSGLDLSTFSALMAGGSSGKAITPGDVDGSLLYKLVTHQAEPNMPPKGKLPDKDLETIKNWIAGGALENSGSKAIPLKKTNDLAAVVATKGRPAGPPPMPEILPLNPAVQLARAGSIPALAASPWAPLVAVGGQQRCAALQHAVARSARRAALPRRHSQRPQVQPERQAAARRAAASARRSARSRSVRRHHWQPRRRSRRRARRSPRRRRLARSDHRRARRAVEGRQGLLHARRRRAAKDQQAHRLDHRRRVQPRRRTARHRRPQRRAARVGSRDRRRVLRPRRPQGRHHARRLPRRRQRARVGQRRRHDQALEHGQRRQAAQVLGGARQARRALRFLRARRHDRQRRAR